MYMVFDGTSWVPANFPYVYDGTGWIRGAPAYWAGTQWQPQSITGLQQSIGYKFTFDVSDPTTPPAPPTQTYTVTKSWSMDWGVDYRGSGDQYSYNEPYLYQGYGTSYSGNLKSLIGFDVGTIPSGATCISATVKLYAAHWYYNSGGTAVIGTHNKTSAPSTWTSSGVTEDRLRYDWNTKTGSRTITLGTTIGNEFLAKTSKGIVLGPGPTTSPTYYGYFVGSGSYKPVLTIKYSYEA